MSEYIHNAVTVTANWTPSVLTWYEYGASLLYPDNGGYEWRVPYALEYYGPSSYGGCYFGHAYFETQEEARQFSYESFLGSQYLDNWTDPAIGIPGSLYYFVDGVVEHFEGGIWSGGWKK